MSGEHEIRFRAVELADAIERYINLPGPASSKAEQLNLACPEHVWDELATYFDDRET